MSESSDRQISNMNGAAALPRSNGELVFENGVHTGRTPGRVLSS